MSSGIARPSVSTRVSIRWVCYLAVKFAIASSLTASKGDADPEEPTSTLVLTAPKGHYIDLRFLVDASTETENKKLDWAFAGLAHKYEGGGSWDHWIDSRSDNPARDVGRFSTLPNGNTLEEGEMMNDSGIIQPYEEIWKDEEVYPEFAVVYVCCEGWSSADVDAKRPLDGDYADSKWGESAIKSVCGMVIRVGSWCQGLLKSGGVVTAERWKYKERWMLECKTGNTLLPCKTICSALSDTEHETISADSFVWKRIDLYKGGINNS